MIEVVEPAGTELRRMIAAHPLVRVVDGECAPGELRFSRGSWRRVVRAGDLSCPVRGLIELTDNNPLVCAGAFSNPSPGGVMALIAFGPLIRAGLLAEPPTLLLGFEEDEDGPGAWLATEGWEDGLSVSVEPMALGEVLAATGIAAIPTPDDWAEVDALYGEAFGRSFFVRRHEGGAWDAAMVEQKPWALYRLRGTPGEGLSLVTVQVMAWRHGKCGAAQLVHTMNVMAGFEENLGIAG